MENSHNLIHSFNHTDNTEGNFKGLTKREYFAILALQGILQNRELQIAFYKDIPHDKGMFPNINNGNCLAIHAIDEADKLLEQLEIINTGA